MKLRLHILFLLIATAVATILAAWMAQPIWTDEGYELVSYAGKNDERSELYSLSSANWQATWFMETHDWRSGQLLRKLPLEVPRRESHSHNLNAPSEGDHSNAILFLTQHANHHFSGPSIISLLLDASNGKVLSHAPISEWCLYGRLARHKNQLALALQTEVRLFRDKHDAGRSIALPGVRKVTYSPDGSTLACVGSDQLLYLVDLPLSEAIRPAGMGNKIFDVSFLRNGQLLTMAANGVDIQAGVQVTRWQRDGSTFRQVGQSTILRCDKELGLPMPVRFEEKDDHSLHLKLFTGSGWPDPLDVMFNWLAMKGIAIEKTYSKSYYTFCFVLDSSNEEVAKYKEWNYSRFKLGDGVAVSYQPDWNEAKRIAVYRTRHIWPWALTVGVVVYVGLWRAKRWRTTKQDCKTN